MKTFKIGDRVAVYSTIGRQNGEIIYIFPDGKVINVRLDNGTQYPAHPKQCRKLVPKKERRNIWIRKDHYEVMDFHWLKRIQPSDDLDSYFEFREVKKK